MGNSCSCTRVLSAAGGDCREDRPGAPESFVEPPIVAKSGPSVLARSILGSAQSSDITAQYELGDVLGRGAFAVTRACTRRDGGARYACKSILKRRLLDDGGDVRDEMQIMRHLTGHPHIVGLADAAEDNAYVHLVMGLCPGGDLVNHILDKGRYTERDAAAAIRSVLKAVAYAHDMGCMHRDIKLDNCLLLDEGDVGSIQLADWGYGTFIKPGEQLHRVCGTSYYMAPEMLNGSYDERADVWSCGVMLYILLAGQPPFYAVCDDAVMRKIKSDGVPNMTCNPWPCITDAAKEAVSRMMAYDPAYRPSAREMLAHEWIREDGVAYDNEIQPEVVHRLRDFAAMNEFRRHAALAIANHIPVDQIRGLHEIFKWLDLDGDGTITAEELRQALAQRGYKLPEEELAQLMSITDINCDGQIDYTEFVAATLHNAVCMQEDNLLMAFKHFDLDGDGRITRDELEQALAATGHAGDAADIISSVDQNGDGVVDYVEFVDMMSCKQGCKQDKPGCGWAAGGGGWGGGTEQCGAEACGGLQQGGLLGRVEVPGRRPNTDQEGRVHEGQRGDELAGVDALAPRRA